MKLLVIIQGIQKYRVFSQFTATLSLAYIAVRDLQISQRNASVQSLPLAGNYLYNQYQLSAGEGEKANFQEFLEKKHNIYEHPVLKKATETQFILNLGLTLYKE